MPEPSSTQSPCEFVSSSTAKDQWNREHVPSEMVPVWNETQAQPIKGENNFVNAEYVSHDFNPTNPPLGYNVQHYINMPYQRSVATVPNGYHAVNMPPPMPNTPVMVHRQPGPSMMPWPSQSNTGRAVQTTPWKAKTNGVKKQKRIRTAFSSQQMMVLEQEYAKTKYLDRTRRIELANNLRLNERTIKIWFQNRRMKEKKDRAESLEEVEEVNSTESPEQNAPMHAQEPFQSNEMFQRQGLFLEQYPVSSTSMLAPIAPQAIAPAGYLPYTMVESQLPYQQVQLQVQQFPSPFEIQESSPDSTALSENSAPTNQNTQSDTNERNWDLSWIRSMQADEEYQ